MNIRKAALGDADMLYGLVKDFTTSFETDWISFEECLKNLIPEESACLYVAETDNKIVGYCLGFDHYAFYSNGRVSWLEEIMVAEAYRGKGIGQKLMAQFEAWAKSRNSKLISRATRRAAPFYQALDYEESAIYYRKLL